MQSIFVLEAQRIQAIKDLDELLKLQEEALSDPVSFVRKLQTRKKLHFPVPQNIHELPVIDWNKYTVDNEELSKRADHIFKKHGLYNGGIYLISHFLYLNTVSPFEKFPTHFAVL